MNTNTIDGGTDNSNIDELDEGQMLEDIIDEEGDTYITDKEIEKESDVLELGYDVSIYDENQSLTIDISNNRDGITICPEQDACECGCSCNIID